VFSRRRLSRTLRPRGGGSDALVGQRFFNSLIGRLVFWSRAGLLRGFLDGLGIRLAVTLALGFMMGLPITLLCGWLNRFNLLVDHFNLLVMC
jgi:hypothetical protein